MEQSGDFCLKKSESISIPVLVFFFFQRHFQRTFKSKTVDMNSDHEPTESEEEPVEETELPASEVDEDEPLDPERKPIDPSFDVGGVVSSKDFLPGEGHHLSSIFALQ